MIGVNRLAVSAVQGLLRAYQPSLVVDGWPGAYTRRAFESAPTDIKMRAEAIVRTFGMSVNDLWSSAKTANANASTLGDSWIPESKAYALIDRAIAQVGLHVEGGAREHFQKKLRREAANRVVGGTRYFNANSVSPGSRLNGPSGYHGLYQMGRDAWQDASRIAQIGDFDRDRYDPWLNTLAAVSYAEALKGQLRAKGYKGAVTSDVLYVAHNQGAGGFMRLYRGGSVEGTQSPEAVALARSIRAA